MVWEPEFGLRRLLGTADLVSALTDASQLAIERFVAMGVIEPVIVFGGADAFRFTARDTPGGAWRETPRLGPKAARLLSTALHWPQDLSSPRSRASTVILGDEALPVAYPDTRRQLTVLHPRR